MEDDLSGCPAIDDLARRLDRVIESVKQLQERNRELQKQIDRLYRVGLEGKHQLPDKVDITPS